MVKHIKSTRSLPAGRGRGEARVLPARGDHPILIGDRLHERYRIAHKLGHDIFSTLWLARDEQLSRYVAVKVGTADSADSSHREVDILSQLSNSNARDGTGKGFFPAVLDSFNLESPNGTHPCFVTAPARYSLADTKQASSGLFQLDVARSLAAQLTLAVVHIHEQGFVHGDLHLGNTLLHLPSPLDALPETNLYTKYRAPEPEPILRLDGAPLTQGVPLPRDPPPNIWLGDESETIPLRNTNLLLTDFGTAFRLSTESRFASYTPLEIRPPEARFAPATPLSFASDIWSLGCTVWALLAHRSLFDALWLASEDNVAAQWVDVVGVGCLPAEWWGVWEAWPKYFTEVGPGRQPVGGRRAWSLGRRYEEWVVEPRRERGLATMGDGEREAFLGMVRGMLAFQPRDRLSAKEVLEMEWMREWAMPEYVKGLSLGG
ncbi:kinase domain-protein [Parachaetomium inaequale]|uniref:Kinase domain-protein n=1 Tax=Parachaetomium inaequale TaxID=2588326 RepID=A0AAN6PIZ2_9PEZI|nr:kinase domain-protein [Parachaetomium inaequale]